MTAVHRKVTRDGRVSLPAELLRRWGAGSVLVVDRGHYAIVRPIPEDTVAALKGAFAGPGPTSEKVRAAEREADSESESRRVTP
jgi:bifunctional DNA-binding transcriptional regulator/antitoxin component of YhaV-PrlF toxin-antitoxin module